MKRPRDLQDIRGVHGGLDTVNVHLAPTLRSKVLDRHPYCRRLRVKIHSALRTFGDLGSLEVQTLSGTIMCRPCGQKESIDTRNLVWILENAAPTGPPGTPWGGQTLSENRVRVLLLLIMSSPIPSWCMAEKFSCLAGVWQKNSQ